LAAIALVCFAAASARLPRAAAQIPLKPLLPRTITVRETAGMERKNWPITTNLLLAPNEAADPATDLSLWRDAGTPQEARVALQVLAVVKPQYVETKEIPAADKQVRLVEICFLADVPANGTATYQLRTVKPEAAPAPAKLPIAGLTYAGEGTGRTVDTGPAIFAFDAVSGQLLSYTPTFTGFKQPLTFNQYKPRPIHWNPDVWAPPLAWGHTSDWDIKNPERSYSFASSSGPIAYRTIRHGMMPLSNGVKTSVTYTAFAGMPFLLESSSMEFTTDTHANAVRNNQLVFNRGHHTHGVWIDEAGQAKIMRGYDPAEPKKFFGYLGDVQDPMIPFVGLFHETRRHGIGMINLSHTTYASQSLAEIPQRGNYYFLDYSDWGVAANYDLNFTYVSRSEIYTPTLMPKGALFAEQTAFLVFHTGADAAKQFEEVQRWIKLLRHPPRVTVNQ